MVLFDAAAAAAAAAEAGTNGGAGQQGNASVLRGKRLTFSTEKGQNGAENHVVRGKRRAATALAEGGEEEAEGEMGHDDGIDRGMGGMKESDLALEGETEIVGEEHASAGKPQGEDGVEDLGTVGSEELPTRTFLEGTTTTMYTRKKTRLGLRATAQARGGIAASQEQWMSSHTATEEQLPKDA